MHKKIIGQISVFAVVEDCNMSNNLEIEYDISDANVAYLIECLNDEDYEREVDVRTFIVIFKFANYLGLSECLMRRITSKLVRKRIELSEFIGHFSKSDDCAVTYEIFCRYDFSIQSDNIHELWKTMADMLPGNILTYVLTRILNFFGYRTRRYTLKYIDPTEKHCVPFIHNIINYVYGPNGCNNVLDQICTINTQENSFIDVLFNYSSYSICVTSSEHIFFINGREICRENRASRLLNVTKTICSHVVSQLAIGYKFNGICYETD